LWAAALWKWIGHVPRPLRRAGAEMIRVLPPRAWDRLFTALPKGEKMRQAGDKLYKLAGILSLNSSEACYRRLISHWDDVSLVVGGEEAQPRLWDDALVEAMPSFMARMQYVDTVTYLPDDILTKVDRASMAISLETRVPLLDHRVVEFAWQLPLSMKIRNGQSKWLLRRLLYESVPKGLVERPKMGFGVPIESWLRNELRDWAEALLDESRLRQEGYLDPGPIRQRWAEHLSGRRNWQYPLWCILMFQAWRERWRA
ncbi:MAG: asparagine synthase C-terminal domain-containing protein, partial [Proteobacteria bacterium]|nr:asparagine synthase C-terminal domain-containing protein [Pseudomonadota bacterium]